MARKRGPKGPNSTSFKKGNTAAAGNPGPRGRPITQAIIAKLNEINKSTSKAYIYDLVDELFEDALSTTIKRGKKTVKIPGSLQAKKEIIDRADGKSVQGIGFEGDGKGKVTVVFEAGDEKL